MAPPALLIENLLNNRLTHRTRAFSLRLVGLCSSVIVLYEASSNRAAFESPTFAIYKTRLAKEIL